MFTHILVPLDGSELAECVLSHAELQARAMNSRITLLHSLERNCNTILPNPVNPVEWHMRRMHAERYLEMAAERLRKTVSRVDTVIVEGPAAESIIDYAHHNGADYMILSSHGISGLTGWNISSVVQKVILRSYVSTLLVRAYREEAGSPPCYSRILLALDSSTRSENVVPVGMMLANCSGSRVFLGHVTRIPELPGHLPPDPDDEHLRERIVQRNMKAAGEYLDQLAAQYSSGKITPEKRLIVGSNIAASIEKLVRAEDIELVIISAHGNRSATDWPYGSVAVNLIVYGTVPLLIMQDVHHSRAMITRAEEAAGEHSGH